MTPYALLMPTPTTVSAPTAKDNKPYADETVRHQKRSGDISKKTDKTDNTSEIKTKDDKKDVSVSDLTLFEQLMASLLNTSPAQTQVNVTANTSVGSNAETQATSQFGASFNMEPAHLIIPQNVNASAALSAAADGNSFNAELLAALTPGIPAPVTEQTALMTQIETAVAAEPVITVPVPAIGVEEPVTPSLTVSEDASADPRLVACGIDPVQMEELKAKLAALPAAQTPSSTSTATNTNITTDSGVISVAFTMPKPEAAVNSQAQTNVQTQVQAQVQAQAASLPPETIAATVKAVETVLPLSVAADAAIKADAASSKISDALATQAIISGEENFDPVEFRIAQSFSKRPVTTAPATSSASTPVNTNASVQANISTNVATQGSAAQTPNVNAAIHGKVNTSPTDTGASLLSTIPTFDLSGEMNLTASPAALPVTFSPLTSTVVHSTNAAQSHPAIQAAAAVIAKNAKEGGAQTISMRLDPPELGKLQVEMKYKKGDPLKVHVVLEKADTASMFMRDAHALESTLKEAGLQLDGSSLSFEFSGDGSFQQTLKGDGSSQSSVNTGASVSVTEEIPALEVTPDIYTDSKTGLTHYSLKA